jgi:hypothetical protein
MLNKIRNKFIIYIILFCSIPVDSFSNATGVTVLTPTNAQSNPAYTYNTRPWVIFSGTTDDGYQINDAQVGFNDGTSWVAVANVSNNPTWGGWTHAPASFYPMPANSGTYIRHRVQTDLPTGKNLQMEIWVMSANPAVHNAYYSPGYSATIYVKTTSWAEAVTAGSTRVKASHLIELRNVINEVRAFRNLGGYSYTRTPATSNQILANDFNQTRTALDQAVNAATGTNITYVGNPAITASSTRIKAADINEMRTAVLMP